jgi:NAD(P)-dependent dehydrogenase (short-subunit alcohol dehydrogenase family)
MSLDGKHILITGSARRLGRIMALAVARAGGTVIIHHGHSSEEASETQQAIMAMGKTAHIVQADLSHPDQATPLIAEASSFGPLFALVNNAAIFESRTWDTTDIDAWNRHLDINLTTPFLLSQSFALSLPEASEGRIVNILDWRALRPGADHLPYTISKAALAALTRSLAIALAPKIRVNGLAFGAILPPSPTADLERIIETVPAKRWAQPDEVGQALIFLLDGPGYITGEILHLDGGRHLV